MPNKARQHSKVILTKKEIEKTTPEYYTYINEKGEEHKYVGIVSKSSTAAYGKSVTVHKVMLDTHPAVEYVKSVPEHFTYVDKDGKEKEYKGKVEIDETTGSYFGYFREFGVTNTVVDIYEEK